jgi:hypothetical protein
MIRWSLCGFQLFYYIQKSIKTVAVLVLFLWGKEDGEVNVWIHMIIAGNDTFTGGDCRVAAGISQEVYLCGIANGRLSCGHD